MCIHAQATMNWDDLRIFLAVARTGSLSGAARQLGIQHSTVSRRMHKLEQNLGSRLLERTKQGYQLTPAGEQARQAALQMEHEVLLVDGTVKGKDTELGGVLRVTAINNMASTVLMPMFVAFSQEHPRVELHISVSNTDASLARREADIAIRLTNRPQETLIGRRMVSVASTIYGSRNYLERMRNSAQKPRWIGVECCNFHRSWTRDHCEGAPHRFYSDDTLLTLAAIREGAGISFLPCFMGDREPALERVTDPDPQHDLGLWVLFHPDLKRTRRVLAFREYLASSILQQQELFEGRSPLKTQLDS